MDIQEITIKANGKWYFGEAEMFRRPILNILASNINRDEEGNFYIKMGEDINPIIVEDAPFLATGIMENEDRTFTLVFHDLQEMPLNRRMKVTLKEDIPYIDYKWTADTRLSRGLYWKLSDWFELAGNEIYIDPPGGQKVD
ncbi:MAG: DUF1285 domain-containing protein [Syntrophomonadaceae bacterium]|jgi:hypothetical protein|nr:DUF1285 domain-containing protein [Syntrophomonadaceae bacterium]